MHGDRCCQAIKLCFINQLTLRPGGGIPLHIYARVHVFLAILTITILGASVAKGATISQEVAVARALEWMSGNPVMSKASQVVESVETFPESGDYSLYVVQLSPQGFLILNSDDRLPLTVSYSPESTVNLNDDPQNALRTMLLDYCERMAEELANWSTPPGPPKAMDQSAAGDELYGPYLETTWNQNNPYNLLCPLDPSGNQYYDYRVPVGCVPTAFAQILHFHRWPYYGIGSNSYSDNSGSITGSHDVNFSDFYDWALMENSYNPWNTEPASSKDAVAELMYELGVAAEVNYESGGTSGSTSFLGNQLGKHFFFESIDHHWSQPALIAPMEADLRTGFPCVVSIPGHAIVADGLMVDGGTTTYHINYGWGGSNNGWFSVDGVPGGALSSGVTALRPRLVPFPLNNAVSSATGNAVELEWIFPKRRANEVTQLEILSLEEQVENWSSDGSEITGNNNGWEIVDAGRSGSCWYVEESYEQHGSALLTLDGIFVPDASAQLTFWQWAILYYAPFSIEVSSDGGESFTEVYTAYDNSITNEIYENSWSFHSVSLSAYAGQQIKLRFSVDGSGWFSSTWAGVRLDDLEVTSSSWYVWEPLWLDTTLALRAEEEVDASLTGQPVHYSTLTGLSAGIYTLAARLIDSNSTAHEFSQPFTLTVRETERPNFTSILQLLLFSEE